MIDPQDRGGRPRLPADPDPKVNRRRAQYRRSKLRRNEQKRHDSGRCLRDDGRRCPIYEPEPEPTLPKPKQGQLAPTSRKVEIGQPFQGRKVMLTPDGRRVWALAR